MDPEKLQAVLTDETLVATCDLNRALETVALIEAQLKEMNPNLDSISEYNSLPNNEVITVHRLFSAFVIRFSL